MQLRVLGVGELKERTRIRLLPSSLSELKEGGKQCCAVSAIHLSKTTCNLFHSLVRLNKGYCFQTTAARVLGNVSCKMEHSVSMCIHCGLSGASLLSNEPCLN